MLKVNPFLFWFRCVNRGCSLNGQQMTEIFPRNFIALNAWWGDLRVRVMRTARPSVVIFFWCFRMESTRFVRKRPDKLKCVCVFVSECVSFSLSSSSLRVCVCVCVGATQESTATGDGVVVVVVSLWTNSPCIGRHFLCLFVDWVDWQFGNPKVTTIYRTKR